MARVKGIGGVFFKSHDPARIKAWYHEHLGLSRRRKQEVRSC